MSATLSIILDTRRVKQSGKYPVKLRVIFQREPRSYQTIFDAAKNEWEKLSAPRLSSELKTLKSKLKQIEKEASAVIENLEPFSFEEFEKKFIHVNSFVKQRKQKPGNIITVDKDEFDYEPYHKKFRILLEEIGSPGHISYSYLEYIKKLIREHRIGTAVSYQCSYTSLKKFKGDVSFSVITTSYLIEYENWLKNQELSKATIGIYLRPLRAIFNEAIEEGLIKREKCYPFGKRKYKIPTSAGKKKALELSDIEKIFFYKCNAESPNEQIAKDYWLFSYFGNGINPKDIANLRYKNFDGEFITFERAKTENTLRNEPKVITIFVNEEMREIIERLGNKDKSPNNYMFPILERGITPLRQYELIQNFVGVINDWMKRIKDNLGIQKKVTTYVARHSFSTVLKRSGASTEYIQEALGHTDIKTTESYLDSFDKETKRELSSRLTAFKNIRKMEKEFI
ncbi:MAG TPA: site-specific integrase [Parafilimonas sp.]|nr:site-specific integrase [Parafilimonas sp.]